MRHRHFLLIGLMGLALLQGGCALIAQPKSSEDREAIAACRSEADRIYAARNRDQIAERGSTGAPFSGAEVPPSPSDGLSDRYAYDKLEDTCLARSGASNSSAP